MDKIQKVTLSELADVYYQQFEVRDRASKKMYQTARDARIYVNEQFGIYVGMLIDVTKPMITDLSDFVVNGKPVTKVFVTDIEIDGDGIEVALLNSKGVYIHVPLQLVIDSLSKGDAQDE